jgi:SAM-dependent methyltransferase
VGDPSEHAFTAVDDQTDPSAWIEVLDRVRQEPAYAAYKERIRELLEPSSGKTYLEVGCGTGEDALALAGLGVSVAGVDVSSAMVDEARGRGLSEVQVASADALPFEAASFDGCWADRVLQHLERPQAALAEMVRVTRSGGRVVVADPDYDTQVVDVEDQDLARRVLRFRADHLLRNGTIAHRAGGLLAEAGLGGIVVEAAPVVLRDPTALVNAMGLRTWAATGEERGVLPAGDAVAWERALDAAVEGNRFLYAFTVFLTAGTVP